jgi:DNA segregation ATPase FtsK/SpoIIIE-like protein
MHQHKPEFVLPKLRRELEELLAMVKADYSVSTFNRSTDEEAVLAVRHEDDAIAAEPDFPIAVDRLETETPHTPQPGEVDQRDKRDALYDDALVVVTEFGQASPVVLQMWLSIDYGRAIKILSQFQADGLVSSKGRVRHKAYSLRRSEQGMTNATI